MNRVREVRIQRGLSLRELARRSRVSLSNLWSIEKEGRSPSIAVGQRIANTLETPLTELFPPDDTEKPPLAEEVAV